MLHREQFGHDSGHTLARYGLVVGGVRLGSGVQGGEVANELEAIRDRGGDGRKGDLEWGEGFHRRGIVSGLLVGQGRRRHIELAQLAGECIGFFKRPFFCGVAIKTAFAVGVVGHHERMIASQGLAAVNGDSDTAAADFAGPFGFLLCLA